MKSKCCNAWTSVQFGDEGTNYYTCSKCLNACDPVWGDPEGGYPWENARKDDNKPLIQDRITFSEAPDEYLRLKSRHEPQLSAEMEKRFDFLWQRMSKADRSLNKPEFLNTIATALEEQRLRYVEQVKALRVTDIPRMTVISFETGKSISNGLQAVDVRDVLALLNGKDV